MKCFTLSSSVTVEMVQVSACNETILLIIKDAWSFLQDARSSSVYPPDVFNLMKIHHIYDILMSSVNIEGLSLVDGFFH